MATLNKRLASPASLLLRRGPLASALVPVPLVIHGSGPLKPLLCPKALTGEMFPLLRRQSRRHQDVITFTVTPGITRRQPLRHHKSVRVTMRLIELPCLRTENLVPSFVHGRRSSTF